jgi:SAM-dependent methyltransferase
VFKETVKRIPGVHAAYRAWNNLRFKGSAEYWEDRYVEGGTSGDGSYGELAAFKAEVLNALIESERIESVLELGCGDGNQLSLARYPRYVGLDVSRKALEMCMGRFASDQTKSFFLYEPRCFRDNAGVFAADCTLSLDVLYHLIEDGVYEKYLADLFGAARRFVGIYSSDRTDLAVALRQAAHVRHRHFTADVAARFTGFRLRTHVPNRYPERSFASFYIYERA